MNSKGILILFICAVSITVTYTREYNTREHTKEQLKSKMGNLLQQLYISYFSSSLLWGSLAYYCNRSELVLPGFSHLFWDFSKIDQEHADRAIELTVMRGFEFSNFDFDSKAIIQGAYDNKMALIDGMNLNERQRTSELNNIIEKYPLCNSVNLTKSELKDVIDPYFLSKNKVGPTTSLPRASFILRFAQMIQECYMNINMKPWKKDVHLEYTIQKDFLTEQVYRSKVILDLIEKLHNRDRWVEFVNDQILRTTIFKY